MIGERSWGAAAARAADFLLDAVRENGRLLATYGKGAARLTAYSTDYAYLADGLLAIYEWNGQQGYLFEAEQLVDAAVDHYWDEDSGGFYLTADDHEQLLVRSKTVQDGATPAANSVMAPLAPASRDPPGAQRLSREGLCHLASLR